MATIDQPIATAGAEPRDFSYSETLYNWVATVDHKRLGLMYVVSALVFLVIAGIMAAVIRAQLAFPNNHVVGPDTYNRLFTMHGTTMVFLVGMPMVAGFSNYLVPLMIGARDMAFPRLNAFGFWIFLFGGCLLYFSYIGGGGLSGAGSAPDVGWFAYAPLTERAFSRGASTDYWILGILTAGIGSIASAINVIVTAISMRCPGMTLARMPVFVWVMVIDSWLILIALPPLTAAQIMLLFDRYLGANFFNTQAGGSAILWQHFFWIFGHPEVYILIFPAFAILSEVIPVFSRKPLFGRPAMVAAVIAIGFISLGVWAHHMFAVGMTAWSNTFFAASTMLVGIPDRNQDLQLDCHHVWRQVAAGYAHAVLLRFPAAVPYRRTDRHHAGGVSVRLAATRLLLRGGAFSLHVDRRSCLWVACRHVLLVPKSERQDVQRASGEVEFLELCSRLQSHFHPAPLRRHARYAAQNLHLSCGTRLGALQPGRVDRRDLSDSRYRDVRVEHGVFGGQGSARGR